MYSELAAVERNMRLLELLASNPDGLSVTEMADRMDLHKANVSRILSTLEAEGYVSQDDRTQLFTLTWRLVAMAYRYADALPLEATARPVLRKLADRTGEMTQLALVQGDQLIFVAKVDGVNPLRVASMVGRTAPLHATAVGKVWLASLPESRALELLSRQGMSRLTETTITDPVKLFEDLRKVRVQGYALAWEEANRSVVALAVPVAHGPSVQACLVVAIPAYEASEHRLEEIRVASLEAARELSDRMPPSLRQGGSQQHAGD